MTEKNQTHITEIILLGFQSLNYWKVVLFISLFIFYCVNICGNLLIITLVSFCKNLHSPMYMFLVQLSICDILLTTVIIPHTLTGVLGNGTVISFSGCISQWYIFGGSEASECFILTAMAYDRYLAICNPLRYSSIMNMSLLEKLSILCWALGFSITLVTTLSIATLDFCGPHIIDHFFCDLAPILRLSCSETSQVKMEVALLSIFVMIFPLGLTGASYGCIVQTILRMSSNVHRRKAFSTCSSHLTVVCIFYGTLIVIYMLPTEGLSLSVSKSIALLYTVVTPMMNPIIYSLRNKDVKDAINICRNLPLAQRGSLH
ncbi:olfactory receptor 11L1-like [Rana temporaria]|uniref:olfactory receptor 11L1-like n=1 Tax=Rana temporaria TaxID=8407 RepID=UPI001AADF44D|nr:olfactory receptor 11L1-like [Rana temporaria]